MAGSLDPLVTEALRSWMVQLEAGIPSSEALELCASLVKGPDKRCFLQASERTANGEGIVAVLDALAPVLSHAERAIIAAGWSAGRVEKTISSLVQQRETWRNAQRRIMGKLVMPAGTLFLASFIAPLPGLVLDGNVFAYFLNVSIPLSLAIGLAIGAVLFFRMRATAPVAMSDGTPLPANNVDRVMLALPLVGGMEQQRSLAEVGELLSHLLNAGLPIVQALTTTARAVRNGCYRTELVRISRLAAQGFPMGPAMSEHGTSLWPADYTAGVTVGEKSGSLDATLARMASAARDRYIRTIEHLADWLPRIIYAVVSMFVAWQILKMALMYIGAIDSQLRDIGA